MTAAVTDVDLARSLANRFIEFLETGHVPDGLFTSNVFTDLTLPTWRLQAVDVQGLVAIRMAGHPDPGRVSWHRFDPTPTGFVLEFDERWSAGGQDWYCRELVRADVSTSGIGEVSVYCTGDWDEARVAEHCRTVVLLRP